MKINDARMQSWFDSSPTRGRTVKPEGANDAQEAGSAAVSPATADAVAPVKFAASLSSIPQADSGSGQAKAGISGQAAEQQFLEWAEVSEAEKIRGSILSRYSLTEDALRALPMDERQKIEDEIEDAVKQHYSTENGAGTESTED